MKNDVEFEEYREKGKDRVDYIVQLMRRLRERFKLDEIGTDMMRCVNVLLGVGRFDGQLEIRMMINYMMVVYMMMELGEKKDDE